MKVRLIEEKDIRQVLNIYNHYIEKTTITFETELLNFAQFRERIKMITAFYPWIVLEEENTILGYAYLSAFNSRAAYQWSADLSLYLDPQAVAQGLGSLLYTEIEALAKQQGFINLVSLITTSNTRSLAFHKKHGFSQCGQLNKVGYKTKWLDVTFCLKKIQEETQSPRPIQPFDPQNFQLKKNES